MFTSNEEIFLKFFIWVYTSTKGSNSKFLEEHSGRGLCPSFFIKGGGGWGGQAGVGGSVTFSL